MDDATPTSPESVAPDRGWIDDLHVQAAVLDGADVAMCAFDLDDRALVWNRTFLRLFPEHDGHIRVGEPYAGNLRRFYEARLDASESQQIDKYIAAGVARHQAQTSPFEFEHRGLHIKVSSLPVPGRGRIRVWRTLEALPEAAPGPGDFASPLGGELLDHVPEALVVCGRDGRIVWANAAYCALHGLANRAAVVGSTMEALYERAWQLAGTPEDASRAAGAALLKENLRFPGAPFELSLPHGRWFRVVARLGRDGAVFHALSDVSALKQYEEDLRLTLDNAGRGIIRYDAAGRVMLFNRLAGKLLDIPEALLHHGASLWDIGQFQQQRGDFAPASDAPQPSLPDLFRPGSYLRRTATGRVLEIVTQPLADGGSVRTYTDVTGYLQAQQALSEKTRALQITLDAMEQGLSAIDGAGRLVLWNRRYQELLDLPDALLQAQPTMDQLVRFQIDRGDFGPDFAFVDAVARGYVSVGDKVAPLTGPQTYLRQTRDGRVLEVVTRPLPDEGVVRTFSDITSSVRSQEALATQQAQLSALVQNLPDSVWLKDAEGRFLLANAAFLRHHELALAQILGKTAPDVFGADRGERMLVTDRRALQGDAPVAFESYDFGAGGELSCAEVVKTAIRDDAGHLIGLLGIARDITARKRQEAALIQAKEEALQASSAKTRFLSSMSHEIRTPMNAILGMLTLLRGTDLSARQQDYAEKAEGAARSLLGLLNDVLDFSKIEAGKMHLDVRPFSLEELLADLSVILSANVGPRDLEVLYDLDPAVPDRLLGDDMRLRQILINLGGNAVKFTPQGEVVVRTRLQACEADRVDIEFSVEDTGIGITPQQQERLFSDYVQAAGDTARQFGGTGLGLGICRRLTELMGSRLQLHSEPGRGSRFWFTVTLARAPEALDEGSGSLEATRVLIVDDNPHAREALAGLCDSLGWQADTAADARDALARMQAASASRPYDAVFLDWRMPGVDGWQACAEIRALDPAAQVPMIIMVTAQGREMLEQKSREEQALLDGYLVKPVTAGMLREAYRSARPRPAASGAAAAPTAQAQPLLGLHLLVAEDNPVNQQIARELLARSGARVEVVGDGQAAVERIRQGASFDAVLMDMQMPVLDGLEATRGIRALPQGRDLPIVAMTANAMDTDRQACMDAGMNDHVAKPFDVARVVETILRHTRGTGAAAPAAAAADGEGLPAFDRAAALAQLGGDEEFLAAVVPVFVASLETSRQQLRQAPEMDSEDLTRLFHSIKGMASNVRADALAFAAGRAEAALRADPSAAREEMTGSVHQAIDAVLAALQEGENRAAAT
jgi:PAS domain S-box-containing protein